MPRFKKQWLLFIFVAMALNFSGCSPKPAQDTKISAPLYGVIDMSKAFKAHPKYNEYQALVKQITTLENEAKPKQATQENNIRLQGLAEYTKNQHTIEINEKQRELSVRLEDKAAEISLQLEKEMAAYLDELEKEYGPKVFNIRLKLSTLQLSKEQIDSLENELKAIELERSQKINSKHNELTARMEAIMAQEKNKADEELAKYINGLDAKQAAVQNDNKQLQSSLESPSADTALLRQQVKTLETFIINDIKDQTAKIAVEKGIETVFDSVLVNVSAEDMTALVIAQFRK